MLTQASSTDNMVSPMWKTPEGATASARRHELDWLRSLVVLGLIPIHAAILFSAASDVQLKNAETNMLLTRLISFTTVFGMPLLFLVAGASSWFALGRRTPRRYVQERLKHLFLPFVFATLLIIPVQVYAVLSADPQLLSTVAVPIANHHALDSYVHFYPTYLWAYAYFMTHYSLTLVPIFWGHLWFLPRLLVTSFVALPLLIYLRGPSGRHLLDRLALLCERPGGIFLLAVPLIITDIALRPGWLNTMTAHWPIFDDWCQFFLYFIFFIWGFVLYADPRFLRQVARHMPAALILGSALWIIAQFIQVPNYRIPFTVSPIPFLFLPFRSLMSWLLTVGMLGVGIRYLARTNRLGRFLNDAAFPIYVIHMPVILVIAVNVLRWPTSVPVKFIVIVLGSALMILAIYELLIKRWPPVRVLFGMSPHERDFSQPKTDPPASDDGGPAAPAVPPDSREPDAAPDAADGLSQNEASARLTQYGFNELADETISPVRRFISHFWGPLPWMLEAAAILAILLRAWGTMWVILANLALNGVVAFWEEERARRAMAALKASLAPQARVRRDGAWAIIPAREVVPGDLIRVRLGDIVPADARLVEGSSLQVDRSTLTGESLPVECERGAELYAGTVVRRGEADALVFATGPRIHFAETVTLVQKAVPVSHLQRIILTVGRNLIIVAIGLSALVLLLAVVRHNDIPVALEYALLLTVTAVPVSMPTVLSVTMAVGAQRLARKGVLVARLAAVEELAAMDSLCADKTGTLTQNSLTTGEIFCADETATGDVLLDAAFASDQEGQDAIDRAVLSGLGDDSALRTHTILAFQPFDFDTKRAEATVRDPAGHVFQVAKGAPQVILALTRMSGSERDRIQRVVSDLAARGYRSLGVARADVPGQWRLRGIIPLFDPLRPDAKQAIADVHALGVNVKLLTGDQHAIGVEIARQVGLDGQLLEAEKLPELVNPDAPPAMSVLDEAVGFTQVLPQHKYRIVAALQQEGQIVGMTGDGVNDAPALRKADVGIAVQGATEAARASSDLVLVARGLRPLVEAIRESRRIFQRMNTYVIYRVAETLRRLVSLTLAVAAFELYPVTPAMLVLLATFNAVVLIALAYDETRPSPIPEVWRMSHVLSIAGVLTVASLAEFFGLFFLGDRVFNLPHPQLQTVLYLALSAAGFFTLLITRTRGPFWSIRPAPILLTAIIVSLALGTLVAILGWFVPPVGWQWALLVVAYSFVWFLVDDQLKLAAYRLLLLRSRHQRPGSAEALHGLS